MDYTSKEAIAQTRQVFNMNVGDSDVLAQIAAQCGADGACTGEELSGMDDANGEVVVTLPDALDATQLSQSKTWREINEDIQERFNTFDAKSRDEKLPNETRINNLNKAQAIGEVLSMLASRFAAAETRLSNSTREEQRSIGADAKAVVKPLTSAQAKVLSDRDREAYRQNSAKVKFMNDDWKKP